jgi:hypothetical protein
VLGVASALVNALRAVALEPPAPPTGQVSHAPSSYWKVTGNDSVLLELFLSPGTGETLALTV